MFRFLFRLSSVGVCEWSVLSAKRNTVAAASVSRAARAGGLRVFSSSSSVRLCEKKNADPDPPTETPAVSTQKAADGEQDEVTKAAEQSEEPAALKTEEGGSPTQQQTDVEQVTANYGGRTKSGKESLLDLLGSMKVEVTNKRKLKKTTTSQPNAAAAESCSDMFEEVMEEVLSRSETLDPELVAAASAAASTLPDRSQAESELVRQLRQHEALSKAQKKGDTTNLRGIIADMKVRRSPNREKVWPANQIRFDDDGRGYTNEVTAERRMLFTGKRLNIFSPTSEARVESAAARPTLWDVEFALQLTQATNQIPRNGLEEMIQWTKEGKMWQYPINNEAGLEEEVGVPFHEHIFLDKHLEEGFPRQGPVRHFMELVVAGLSRNPYLTVQQKKDHISWFRDYFHQKQEVLKEAEAYLK